EISPLGLVEMTRQNVTDGPREILTRKCPVCEGDGVVVSDASVAIDVERRLRSLAAGSRHKAFKVAVNEHVASLLIGSGAQRLADGTAYATLVKKPAAEDPITAEDQAEKPTRKPPARRTKAAGADTAPAEPAEPAEPPEPAEPEAKAEPTTEAPSAPKPKKKT